MAATADTFDRAAVTGGWGTSTSGGLWTASGGTVATDYETTGTIARHKLGTVNASRRTTIPTSGADVDVVIKIAVTVLATGTGSIQVGLIARYTDGSNYYFSELLLDPTTNAVSLRTQKLVAGSFTSFGTVATGLTHSGSNQYWLRFQVKGSTLRARVWLSGNTEPTTWLAEYTDTALPTGSAVGVRSSLGTGNTNTLPVTIAFDDFTATPVEISATEQDTWPPRVLVAVTGLTVDDSIELLRVVDGRRIAIRGGSSSSVTDTSFLCLDAELPFGATVSYLAIVNGTDEYSTASNTYALPGGKVAVSDAINGDAAEVVILAWDEKQSQRQASVFRVGGRNVVVSGDLGMFEANIELFTETTTSHDSLIDVLRNATEGIIQIRQDGNYDGVDSYVAVLGMTVRRFSQDGTDQRRIFNLQVAEVEGWAPALEARGFTYADLEAAYTGLTYADLEGDYTTYLALAQADLS